MQLCTVKNQPLRNKNAAKVAGTDGEPVKANLSRLLKFLSDDENPLLKKLIDTVGQPNFYFEGFGFKLHS